MIEDHRVIKFTVASKLFSESSSERFLFITNFLPEKCSFLGNIIKFFLRNVHYIIFGYSNIGGGGGNEIRETLLLIIIILLTSEETLRLRSLKFSS